MKRLINYIKHCYQRITKGYSYRDLWNIDMWFLNTFPKMLEDFKKVTPGYPGYMTQEEYYAVLDRMIFLF